MGSLFLHIGQCGCQIGDIFWQNILENHYVKQNFLFDGNHQANAIFVDTEPKVLQPLLQDKNQSSFINRQNIYFQQEGRGNNWAMGFHTPYSIAKDCPPQPIHNLNLELLDSTLEMIRKQIESIDFFMGTVMVGSLGGGTGSGLSSRLAQEMKDTYSGGYLHNVAVFPSSSGENSLQHYNSLLCVRKLQEFSDSVIYFQNEKINGYLMNQIRQQGDNFVDLKKMNIYISQLLSKLILLNQTKGMDRFYFDVLNDLTPLPEMKFLELYGTPYDFQKKKVNLNDESKWEILMDRVIYQSNFIDEENKSKPSFTVKTIKLAFQSHMIEKTLLNNQSLLNSINYKIKNTYNPVSWSPESLEIQYINQDCYKAIDLKNIFMLLNRNSISNYLQEIHQKSLVKYKVQIFYQANAFLQHYHKFGMQNQDFEEAFEMTQNIIQSYESLEL